jgi:hypothetical protein
VTIDTDYDWTNYTVVDNTGTDWDVFSSAYKNLRFNVPTNQQIQLTASTAANLPGLAYLYYGDTSLWRALLAYNGWSDPLSEVAPGVVMNIPTKAALLQYLSSQKATNVPVTITI